MIDRDKVDYPDEWTCEFSLGGCGTRYRGSLVRFACQSVCTHSGRLVLKGPCVCCVQEKRQEKAKRDPLGAKVASVIRTHASRLKKSTWTLIHEYRWRPDRIYAEMELQWDHGICQCGHPFKSPKGLQNLTVDLINRDAAPYWGTNTQYLCATCNKEKGKVPPEVWQARNAVWEERKRQLAAGPSRPAPVTLWEWVERNGDGDAAA